ncbi:hypothetical protein FCE95_16910 [Luteimonas gilva]|uniref:Uncharacterized protein n=1 Tax=Luteimonas gilva TaxID=2572684 RepID=A0A4U5JK57_9GAMM|nr:hypothetical protein [Luteimonas gilva]TKR29794.1 hypothetical protein FCE95_16910 [Luteimonas gilva]
MARKYEVAESVGKSWGHVDSYESIEKHHPTWVEDLNKRRYAEIDGSREEYVESPTHQRMVSKDLVLSVEGSALVDVPSPVSGYIRRSPRLDRWGTVEIYNRSSEDAELIARVRHMHPIHVQEGQKIEYGQLLGRQSNKAPPGVKVGLHTHIDFNEWQLNHFREYIRDLDTGVITPEGRIDEYQRRDSVRPHMDSERPADRWLGNTEPQQSLDSPRSYSDPRHPDHALHETIRRHLPAGTSDEMAAHVTLQAKVGCVRDAEHLDIVMVHEGRVFVMSKTPGFRAHVDLSETPPPISETMQRSESLDAQRAQQREQWMAQEQQLTQGRSLSRSL